MWQRTVPNFYQGQEFTLWLGKEHTSALPLSGLHLCYTWDRMVSRRDRERGRAGGPQSGVVACSAFQSALDPLVKRKTMIQNLSIHEIFYYWALGNIVLK
jgi:hypothetical protein